MSGTNIAQALQAALSYHQSGRLEEAEAIYRQVLAAAPEHPTALHLLGVLAHQCGQHEEAAALFTRSLAVQPNNAAALSSFGEIHLAQGRREQAQACFERALAINPKLAPAHNHLGTVLLHAGRAEEACQCFGRAAALRPDFFDAQYNLGSSLLDLGRLADARPSFERALAIQPDHPGALHSLGVTLARLYQSDGARRCFERTLALQPDHAEAVSNLAAVLKDTGQIDAAIACQRRALALRPGLAGLHSNLIYLLHFDAATTPAALRAECDRWEEQHAAPLRSHLRPPANDPDPARRLRIGFVSADFCQHPLADFLTPLLRARDRAGYEVHCYSDVAHPDGRTMRLRTLADRWHEAAGLPDEALAEQIRADGIDILVDLALHSAGNRLPVFARQPAPVQVSWLGYASTTGLTSIRHRLTDRFIDPPGGEVERAWPRERPVRLPDSWCCYDPPAEAGPVGALPALTHAGGGNVTFGAFNQFAKGNERVWRLWARVLAATPGSQLRLACHEPAAFGVALAVFAHEGIDAARVRIVPWLSKGSYLRLHGEIDIALDPFPHNGMTTTCDALYMGVPVVTLPGVLPVSRTGLSLLTNVGLPQLAARDEDEYVRLAAGLAGDLPALAELRAGLRERMRLSPLMDAARFAANVEAAFRRVWREWCEGAGERPSYG